MSFGTRLRSLRMAAKMTQEELAARTGVQKQHVSRWENDKCEPNIRTAKKLADALGVTLGELSDGVYPSAVDSSPSDDRHKLVNELFDRLPQEKQDLAIALLRGLSQSPADPDGK